MEINFYVWRGGRPQIPGYNGCRGNVAKRSREWGVSKTVTGTKRWTPLCAEGGSGLIHRDPLVQRGVTMERRLVGGLYFRKCQRGQGKPPELLRGTDQLETKALESSGVVRGKWGLGESRERKG